MILVQRQEKLKTYVKKQRQVWNPVELSFFSIAACEIRASFLEYWSLFLFYPSHSG